MLYAYINNKRFSIEDKDNEYEIYEYIKNKYGEVKDEINDIPYYIVVFKIIIITLCDVYKIII